MNKSYTLLFLLFTIFLSAQTPTIDWQDMFGGTAKDEFRCAIETADGGYIATGLTFSTDGDILLNHGVADLLLVKYMSGGAIEWKKTLGGSNIDIGNAVRQTADGGYIICGITHSTDGDATATHDGGEYWIIKTNSLGEVLWQKSYGGNGYDEAYDIRQTIDGGYIVIGECISAVGGDVASHYYNADVWILKLDALGNMQWQKNYGGNGGDTAFTILQMADGNYVFSAMTNSCGQDVIGLHDPYNCTGSFVNNDFWIVKLDSLGNVIWKTTLGTDGQDGPRWSQNSMALTTDGGLIVCGSSNSSWASQYSRSNYKVYKLSSEGITEWEKKWGGTYDDAAHCVIQTVDGGFVFAGYTSSNSGDVSGNNSQFYGSIGYGTDIWIVKTDAVGNIQWKKCYGGLEEEFPYSIAQTADNGFIIAGKTDSNNSGDVIANNGSIETDGWIFKLSAVSLETESFETKHISLFPNPTSGILTLQSSNLISSYLIYDALGRQVQNGPSTTTIDVSNLSAGVYIFKGVFENAHSVSQKFVKQ